MDDKQTRGKKLRVISKLVERAIEDLSTIFENKNGLSQRDLDVVRAILWTHLEEALVEGFNDTHGLKMKIQFLEGLLSGSRDPAKGK